MSSAKCELLEREVAHLELEAIMRCRLFSCANFWSFVFVLVALADPSAAQNIVPTEQATIGRVPHVEFGGHMSIVAGHIPWHGQSANFGGARVTVNVSQRIGVELFWERQFESNSWLSRAGHSLAAIQARLVLTRFRRGAVFATAGGGVWKWDVVMPAAWDSAAFASRGTTRAFVAGFGVEIEMRHAALRTEIQFLNTTENSSAFNPRLEPVVVMRMLVGMTVPIGHYPQPPKRPGDLGWTPTETAAPTTVSTDHEIQAMTRGRHVWVTMTDGREWRGVATSGSSIVLTAEPLGVAAPFTIRKIEAADRTSDGLLKGVLIGGLGLGIPFGILGSALHHNEGGNYSGMVLGMTALGVGAGGLIGWLIDYGHTTRVTLFDSTKTSPELSLTPMLGANGAGVRGVVRW